MLINFVVNLVVLLSCYDSSLKFGLFIIQLVISRFSVGLEYKCTKLEDLSVDNVCVHYNNL